MHVISMIRTHPQVGGDADVGLARCIEACFDCARTCISCADACLAEVGADHLKNCIRLDLDCADICAATAKIASRRTGNNVTTLRALLAACAEACRVCGEECERHGEMHGHCRICSAACRHCEKLCRDVADMVAPVIQ
jgi:hypothetical protein